MFYCDDCAKRNDWPETMFRSLGTCEECGARAECSERSTRDLAGEDRAPIRKPEEMDRSPEEVVLAAMNEGKVPNAGAASGSARSARPAEGRPATFLFGGRGTPPSAGGGGRAGDDGAQEPGRSRHGKRPEGVIAAFAGVGVPEKIVPLDGPPPAPPQPAFTRILSAEGFSRWVKRSAMNDDPSLNAHCIELRRRWLPFGVAFGRALDRLPWNFPTFAPHARPYDWAADR